MTTREAVARFLVYLEAERNASPHTRAAYGGDLESLAVFLDERESRGAHDVRAIDVYALRGWLGGLARTLAASSVARKVAAVRTWMGWLQRIGTLDSSPADELATPKVRRPLPTFLGVDAAKDVVEAPTGDDPMNVRDRAVLELLYGSGIRVGELAALNLGDVDLAACEGRVLGKGRKERMVPIGGKCAEALRAWLVVRPNVVHAKEKTQDPRALFLSVRGARFARCSSSCTSGERSAPGAPTFIRTRFVIRARRTCSAAAPISAPSRRCSATRRSRRRSGTRTCRSSTS
jgi:integrase/recombinase XerC